VAVVVAVELKVATRQAEQVAVVEAVEHYCLKLELQT
jgi:hypothetical protein